MEYDEDGDGKLSKSELPERMVGLMFVQADTNKDGFLDRAEIEVFFESRNLDRVRGDRRSRGEGSGPPGRGVGGQGGFDSFMSAAGRSLRGLGKSEFSAGSLEDDLQRMSDLQAALVGAKSRLTTIEMSEDARKQFGGDVAAYQRAFRLELVAALVESLKLEQAIIEPDGRAAAATVEKLTTIRNRAHAIFQPKDEDDQKGDRDDQDQNRDDDGERDRGRPER